MDMKLGTVTKHNKQKKRIQILIMTSFGRIVTSFSFLCFMSNLEQFGSRTQNAYAAKFAFSLKVTF